MEDPRRNRHSLTPLLALAAMAVPALGLALLGLFLLGSGGDVSADPASIPSAALTEAGEGVLPSYLLHLPRGVTSAVVVDLESNTLHLYRNGEGGLSPAETYYVSIGKQGIHKQAEGDEKTPVGLYYVTSHLPGQRLPEIYGAGALPMSYPNAWDRRQGRTGSGIWIHGTDRPDGELPARSSRGCLALANRDFLALTETVDIGTTPVLLTDTVEWAPAPEIARQRDEVLAQVEAWRRDWESLDTRRYLGHYSARFRTRQYDLAAWSSHKLRVNRGKAFIDVGVSNLSAFRYPGEDDLVLVTFDQSYRSSNYRAHTRKHQYWRREAGGWRIVYDGDGKS